MKAQNSLTVTQAAKILAAGDILAMPTETVYGLAADASNPKALAKIFAKKGRPSNHPLIVHLYSAQYLPLWAEDISPIAYQLADKFWPGPLTLILKKSAIVPSLVTGEQDTVALRVPAHPIARELLANFAQLVKSGGIAAPSANRFGHISPTCPEHVYQSLGTDIFLLDGGACSVGIESTIVDLTSHEARILRPGQISATDLSSVLHYHPSIVNSFQLSALANNIENHIELTQATINSLTSSVPRTSGTLLQHYSPHTPCFSLPADALGEYIENLQQNNITFAYLGIANQLDSEKISKYAKYSIILSDIASEYAKQLYAALYQLDQSQAQQIVILLPPSTEEWLALSDRIIRASAK